jgi:hydroxylamine reductase
MFCYQCEQTGKGSGCVLMGVCGKDETSATLQDLIVYAAKGIAMYAHRAAKLGFRDSSIDKSVIELLFATVTNVDFDPKRLQEHLAEASKTLAAAKILYEDACSKSGLPPEKLAGPAVWRPAGDLDGLLTQGSVASITRPVIWTDFYPREA